MSPVCQSVTFLDPQNRFIALTVNLFGTSLREVKVCAGNEENLFGLIDGYCENKPACTAKGETVEQTAVINTLEYCQEVVSTDHAKCLHANKEECVEYVKSDNALGLYEQELCAESKADLDLLIKGYCVGRPACTPRNDVYVRLR